MASVQALSKRALLVILDGYGINDKDFKNAVKHANTPTLDSLFNGYPFTTIEAGGESVGLPKGLAGNSEVGHMNLGAGSAIRQDIVRINEAIEKNTLKDMEKLKELISTAQNKTKRVHLMGLLSDGGVHSHIDHIKELTKIISNETGLEIFFHAMMDGRDTQHDIGEKFLTELDSVKEITIASMQGRSIGMDRDRRWEKIELSYKTMTAQGSTTDLSPKEYLRSEYDKGIYDEFITPVLFDKNSAISEGDCVFFINFRPDRAIQMSLAMNDLTFSDFEVNVKPGYFLCMTPYIQDEVELPILFNKEVITGGISNILSDRGYKQLKIAETEKYAHVTFFFNGGRKAPFPGEEHVLVPSDKSVKTYDEKPEMSAHEVTEKLLNALDDESIKFSTVNYANSDMVGHTGNFDAVVKAIEVLDGSVKRLMDKCVEKDITMLITADHGNSDQMTYSDGKPHTSHTNSPVPCCIFHKKLKSANIRINGSNHSLKDVAATLMYIMGEKYAKNFTGKNIFR